LRKDEKRALVLADLQKKKFAPVYLFYGDELFNIDEKVDYIINNLVEPANRDFNLDILYGDEADGAKIVNIAMSYPMMCEKRVVIVRDIHQLKTASLGLLVKYAAKPVATTCLVMTTASMEKQDIKKLEKLCAAVEFKQLYDNQIPDWIQKRLATKNITITPDAIRLLQGSAGNSLQNLSTELDKLLLNLGQRTRIEVNDVEAIIGASKQYTIFELCDAVAAKQLQPSLLILNNLLQLGETPGLIITMLNRHFTRLLLVKELVEQRLGEDKIAVAIKAHPFFVKGYLRQAKLYNIAQLKQSFVLLLETDELLKSSSQKDKLLLELLIVKLYYM